MSVSMGDLCDDCERLSPNLYQTALKSATYIYRVRNETAKYI